jgi:sugar lactone lactonase YvrE
VRAQQLSTLSYEHGEGVRWDAARDRLLWVDIGAGRVQAASLSSIDTPDVREAGTPVGAVTTTASGALLLAAGEGLLTIDDGGQRQVAVLEPPHVRMNDAACDPAGRFWAGSMAYDGSEGAGSLHRLDLHGEVSTVLTGLTISNGLGWSPDARTMYLNDSGPSVTWAFDYAIDTGEISNRRALAHHDNGVCDGLAVDDEGCLWVALWGGAAVDRIAPDGRRLQRIDVPVRQPSDCCLVGEDLVITTARHGLSGPGDADGRLFIAHVGVSGPPLQPFAGTVPIR